MLNESSRWPNFGPGVVREKNKESESKGNLPIDPEVTKKDVNWRKSWELLETTDDPETAFKIYQQLASHRDKFKIDGDIRGRDREKFLEELIRKAAQDPQGFAILEKDIEKSESDIAPIFRFVNLYKPHIFKTIIVKALFKTNPVKAGEFAISFLERLPEEKKLSLEKEKEWEGEIENVEKGVKRKRNVSTQDKNKQAPPHEEFVDSSRASSIVFSFDEGLHEVIGVIINNLGRYAAENNSAVEAIDALTDYLTKDHRAFGHTKELTECFEKTDINYSAQKLLGALRDTETDPWARKLATNILYRLEFGRLGISSEGVKYLERMYDLGELNNPDYFAQRLTRNGEVGIFNESKELINYFELGDLSSDQEKVKVQVLSFTYETLFIPQAGESDIERAQREKVLEEFKQNYFSFFDDRFLKTL